MSDRKSYINDEGDALELDEEFFATAKRGRPAMPEDMRKRRVSIMLDPDVLEQLKSSGKGWQTRANAMLRDALGLE